MLNMQTPRVVVVAGASVVFASPLGLAAPQAITSSSEPYSDFRVANIWTESLLTPSFQSFLLVRLVKDILRNPHRCLPISREFLPVW